MADLKFGANILETLTVGMYKDSKAIYREYIQNACDQIDKALAQGILTQGDGEISIWLDYSKKKITIKDNATGIKQSDFQRVLGSIADSDKKIGEDKGFIGIGRLFGLAYCQKLIFQSKAKGENTVSIMECDAEKMKQLITEHQSGNKKTAQEVWEAINTFSTEESKEKDEHYFQVELININDTDESLLNASEVKKYLSFIAPCPYQNTFIYREEIYKYAKEHKFKIDEYKILLNGEQIFKKYSADLKDGDNRKYDEIRRIAFKEFKNCEDKTMAWLWYGISSFKGIIPDSNEMRGIRLRNGNIQIGDENALQDFFKEKRGVDYFIGELFALSNSLRPNARRDYFEANKEEAEFREGVKFFCRDELQKIYRTATEINSAFKKKLTYDNSLACPQQDFIDAKDKEKQDAELLNKKNKSEGADKEITKLKQKHQNNEIIKGIIDNAEKTYKSNRQQESSQQQFQSNPRPFTKTLSKLDRKKQKLVSEILAIVQKHTDKNSFEKIKDEVLKEFK